MSNGASSTKEGPKVDHSESGSTPLGKAEHITSLSAASPSEDTVSADDRAAEEAQNPAGTQVWQWARVRGCIMIIVGSGVHWYRDFS